MLLIKILSTKYCKKRQKRHCRQIWGGGGRFSGESTFVTFKPENKDKKRHQKNNKPKFISNDK